MIIIPLSTLQSAATVKPPGYYDACVAAGIVVDDSLELSESAFADLRARFSPPPISTQLQSAVDAVVSECGAILAGNPPVNDATKSVRIGLCEACDSFIVADRRCQKCGCWMDIKTSFRTASCPEEKW